MTTPDPTPDDPTEQDERTAAALERIADALERIAPKPEPPVPFNWTNF